MTVQHAADAPTERGQQEWFTGTVWLDELCVAPRPSGLRVHRVSFEPSARTRWHSHPVGQVLHAVSGEGWICFDGAPPEPLAPGDTVWVPPNRRHWHGAAAQSLFVHLAIQEADAQGHEADWSGEVSDADYACAGQPS